MAKWKAKIQLGDLFKRYQQNKLTVQEVAHHFAKRLRALPYYSLQKDFRRLVDEINDLSTSKDDISENDFDEILNLLYDWGDLDQRLWISTL